ncbi:vancomycin high temperature exclusion protein [Marinoscillum sp. MHG1-6]|uniref:SanA/YdcF family protein n=1 Tax=Marinoscillum sp. MHG1-6 TaxID=2959627 RepID=UPI00215860EF|nr:ElyC/SanA/YdcF family protein [Marinoscillum sp. MHG1-6]
MFRLIIRVFKYLIFTVFAVGILVLGINFWVIISTEDQVYYNINNVPQNKVALILGTSKRTSSGDSNQYFHERIAAAAELYHHGKVSHIIVSGDNRTKYYNEPKDMYNALLERNVPTGAITLDVAGLRTLDSMVRSREVFGQKSITIVTQDFHCYRSLFIANYLGLEAIAFAADNKQTLSTKLAVREIFARFAAIIDLYVWDKVSEVKDSQK